MDFIINNWQLIIAAIAIISVVITSVYNFIKMPRSRALEQVQEWLLLAVAEAEKEFGSGTGQLKLRYVYDLFINRFPSLAKIISFEYFSQLVDKALEKFNNILSSNKQVQNYVNPVKEE